MAEGPVQALHSSIARPTAMEVTHKPFRSITIPATTALAGRMPRLVTDFLDRPMTDDRMLPAGPALRCAFAGLNRQGTKLNPLHNAPRRRVPFQDADAGKARVAERPQKRLFRQRAGDAAGPELGIALHGGRNFFSAGNV